MMEDYYKTHKTSWYEIPDNVVGVIVNPIDGTIATDDSPKKEMFFYLKGTEPSIDMSSKNLEAVFKEENKSISE